MQVRRLLVLTLAVSAVVVAGLEPVTAQKGAKAPRIAKLSMGTGPTMRVFDDGAPYIDYRSVQATASDFCVEISAETTFVRLNRPIGDLGSGNCNYPSPPVRNFWLQIDDATACAHFNPGANPNAYWLSESSCRVSGHDRPRIRATDVFKSRVSKIPVAFLILNYDDTYSFEVRTNVDATVAANGEIRTVTNLGNVTLWKFHPFPQQATPEATFSMPFQLIFERLPG